MNARVNNLPGTTPLVAMALIDMAVSKVCVEGKGTDFNGNITNKNSLTLTIPGSVPLSRSTPKVNWVFFGLRPILSSSCMESVFVQPC